MKYEIDGVYYNVDIQIKRIRNLYIRFKENCICISTPKNLKDKEIIKLLDNNIKALQRMIKREQKKDNLSFLGNDVDVVAISNLKQPEYYNHKLFVKDRTKVDEALKYLAIPIFKDRLEHIYALFEEKIPFPTLRVRKMSSRWGVCNRKSKVVTLNLELIKREPIYIDYVIVHELSHFVHFDHSQAFWQTVSKYCPSYKLLRKNLRE